MRGRLVRMGYEFDVVGPNTLATTPQTPRADHGDMMIAPLPKSFRSPNTLFLRRCASSVQPSSTTTLLEAAGARLAHSSTSRLAPCSTSESGDLILRLVRATNLLTPTDHVDVVITTGPHIDPAELPSPGPRVRIETFVAQRELLGRCRAVVCHAGSGTIVDALTLGIPVVALPLGADQPDNAERCEHLGAGIILDAVSVAPDRIADHDHDRVPRPVVQQCRENPRDRSERPTAHPGPHRASTPSRTAPPSDPQSISPVRIGGSAARRRSVGSQIRASSTARSRTAYRWCSHSSFITTRKHRPTVRGSSGYPGAGDAAHRRSSSSSVRRRRRGAPRPRDRPHTDHLVEGWSCVEVDTDRRRVRGRIGGVG